MRGRAGVWDHAVGSRLPASFLLGASGLSRGSLLVRWVGLQVAWEGATQRGAAPAPAGAGQGRLCAEGVGLSCRAGWSGCGLAMERGVPTPACGRCWVQGVGVEPSPGGGYSTPTGLL